MKQRRLNFFVYSPRFQVVQVCHNVRGDECTLDMYGTQSREIAGKKGAGTTASKMDFNAASTLHALILMI